MPSPPHSSWSYPLIRQDHRSGGNRSAFCLAIIHAFPERNLDSAPLEDSIQAQFQGFYSFELLRPRSFSVRPFRGVEVLPRFLVGARTSRLHESYRNFIQYYPKSRTSRSWFFEVGSEFLPVVTEVRRLGHERQIYNPERLIETTHPGCERRNCLYKCFECLRLKMAAELGEISGVGSGLGHPRLDSFLILVSLSITHQISQILCSGSSVLRNLLFMQHQFLLKPINAEGKSARLRSLDCLLDSQ